MDAKTVLERSLPLICLHATKRERNWTVRKVGSGTSKNLRWG